MSNAYRGFDLFYWSKIAVSLINPIPTFPPLLTTIHSMITTI